MKGRLETGDTILLLQSRHIIADAEPRLLRKSIDCSPFCNLSCIAVRRGRENGYSLPNDTSARSMILTFGSALSIQRFISFTSWYSPDFALDHDSSDGVAVPSTSLAPENSHNFCAVSRAEYRGACSFLYVHSCSSSIITRPKFRKGAKSALLEPITSITPPLCTLTQAFLFCDGVSRLCTTAIFSFPISSSKRLTQFSVRSISGTRRIDCLPLCAASAMSFA